MGFHVFIVFSLRRFIVIDGNKKLCRLVCDAPKTKVIPMPGQPTTYNQCIRDPVRGNQNSKASKCCELHKQGKSDFFCCISLIQLLSRFPLRLIVEFHLFYVGRLSLTGASYCKLTGSHISYSRSIFNYPDCFDLGQSAVGVESLDFRRITRSMALSIPPVITSGEGCKKAENIDRFHSRTAGTLYFFRPCCIRVSHWEMVTAESLSLVMTSIVDAFSQDRCELNGIVYDRACDLHPFVKRLSAEGNTEAQWISTLQFVVDVWHAEKHTMPKCTIGDPRCEYHQQLERFQYLKDMNTEAAEQAFRLLNPFKFITNRMTYGRRLLYMKLMDKYYNEKRVEEWARSKPLSS